MQELSCLKNVLSALRDQNTREKNPSLVANLPQSRHETLCLQ